MLLHEVIEIALTYKSKTGLFKRLDMQDWLHINKGWQRVETNTYPYNYSQTYNFTPSDLKACDWDFKQLITQ